jgi:hypothetical protein
MKFASIATGLAVALVVGRVSIRLRYETAVARRAAAS